MYIQFPRKKKRKKKAHRVNRYFGYIMSSTYADHLSCFRWSAFFYFFWFGIFSFLLDEPVTLPSCFFVFFLLQEEPVWLFVSLYYTRCWILSTHSYTVFNDSRERVRFIIKLSMINKLVDANGWWGGNIMRAGCSGWENQLVPGTYLIMGGQLMTRQKDGWIFPVQQHH